MRARAERILAGIPGAVDAVLIMNGSANFRDRTLQYVSGVTRGGYEGCCALLRPGERPLLVVSALEEESARTAPDCDLVAYRDLAAQKKAQMSREAELRLRAERAKMQDEVAEMKARQGREADPQIREQLVLMEHRLAELREAGR